MIIFLMHTHFKLLMEVYNQRPIQQGETTQDTLN